MEAQKIFDLLKENFGDAILSLDTENSIPEKISVKPDSLRKVCEFLKDNESLSFDSLMCLSGIDLGSELGSVVQLFSFKNKLYLSLECLTDSENPKIDSLATLYQTADWHERESYDMFGIIYEGHPKLTRMFLPDDWEGHPLKKDYKPADYWHGMPIGKELTHKMK